VRLQIVQNHREVTIDQRTLPIRKAFKKYCLTELENRLLFRLANRFQPKTILVTGSNFGLTPLYLTAYSKKTECVVIEPEPMLADITHCYLEKYGLASIKILNNLDVIPDKLDLIVWNHSFSLQTFEQLFPHINEKSVIVIAGIKKTPSNQETWKKICIHPKVTVTLDLYRLGIVFFNPKLHQKTYKSVVL
jgi:predicted O-methyltransferase YrrM